MKTAGGPNRRGKLTNVGAIAWLVASVVYLYRPYAPKVHLLDPQFRRSRKNYLIQVALATVAIFVVLLLVDSLSDAALAAGLGSSALIVFLNPSNRSASSRSLIGGHLLGVLIGLGFSLLLFSTPPGAFLTSSTVLRVGILAASMGILMAGHVHDRHRTPTGCWYGSGTSHQGFGIRSQY